MPTFYIMPSKIQYIAFAQSYTKNLQNAKWSEAQNSKIYKMLLSDGMWSLTTLWYYNDYFCPWFNRVCDLR